MQESNISGKKILVVDDEELIREIVTDYLKRYGAIVYGASNGIEAFEELKKTKIDILFTDIRMPGGDGVSLIKEVRSKLDYIPKLLICSGFSDVSTDEIEKLNVDKIFTKPVDPEDIKKVIEKL